MLFKSNHGSDTSMKKFMETNLFTSRTKDYIDRICRLTDGASSENYSLNKFLQLINQQYMHKIYQPNTPNDMGLFKHWKNKLKEQGVTFMFDSKVLTLQGDTDNIKYINILQKYKQIQKIVTVSAKKYVLCIPPKPLFNILNNSDYSLSFGDFNNVNEFAQWVQLSSYSNYIPIAYHWNQHDLQEMKKLPDIWGFPKSEWGIAFIVLSQYMNFSDSRSKLVISTCVTKPDSISSFTKKTANQSSEDELKQEVFRQLKLSFPNLPVPSLSILNPRVYKENMNGNWNESDTAFIETYRNKPLSSNSKTIKNLYQVGTQNGHSKYKFTTMESAIINALFFANQIEPETRKIITIKNNIELNDIIRFVLIIILVIVILKLFKSYSKK